GESMPQITTSVGEDREPLAEPPLESFLGSAQPLLCLVPSVQACASRRYRLLELLAPAAGGFRGLPLAAGLVGVPLGVLKVCLRGSEFLPGIGVLDRRRQEGQQQQGEEEQAEQGQEPTNHGKFLLNQGSLRCHAAWLVSKGGAVLGSPLPCAGPFH